MNPQFREHKRAIRAFLGTVTDERLALLEERAAKGDLDITHPENCLHGVGTGYVICGVARLDNPEAKRVWSAWEALAPFPQNHDGLNAVALEFVRAEIARRARALTASVTREVAHA